MRTTHKHFCKVEPDSTHHSPHTSFLGTNKAFVKGPQHSGAQIWRVYPLPTAVSQSSLKTSQFCEIQRNKTEAEIYYFHPYLSDIGHLKIAQTFRTKCQFSAGQRDCSRIKSVSAHLQGTLYPWGSSLLSWPAKRDQIHTTDWLQHEFQNFSPHRSAAPSDWLKFVSQPPTLTTQMLNVNLPPVSRD